MVYDDYGHNPTELEVDAAHGEVADERPADRRLSAARRRAHAAAARELGAALGLADAAIVTDIIGARDAPREGSAGKLVVDSLPPDVRAGWAPSLDDAAALALAWARPGDLVITFGVGEPWKIARAIVDGLPAMSPTRAFEEGLPLSRLTTIGTGGAGAAYAEPRTLAELEMPLRAGRDRGLAGGDGGSRLERARGGRAGRHARPAADGRARRGARRRDVLVAGGGATNAVCLHRARAAALGGFEFACAIPGRPAVASG